MFESGPKKEKAIVNIELTTRDGWVYYRSIYNDGTVGPEEDSGFAVPNPEHAKDKYDALKKTILANGVPPRPLS